MIPSNYSAVAKITAFLITFAALAPSVLAKGLAALREQSYHSKDRAKLFFFEDVQVFPYQIRFEIKGKADFVTKNSPTCEWVESLPHFSKNLLQEKDIEPYRKSLKECEDFLVNYPHAKKHLDPYTQILKDEIGKFDSGLIKHNDNWISKERYEEVSGQKGGANAVEGNNNLIKIKVEGYPEQSVHGTIRDYNDVEIINRTPSAITVMHGGGGLSRVPFEEVPKDIRGILEMNEDEAKEYDRRLAENNRKRAQIERANLLRKKLLRDGKFSFRARVFQVVSDGCLLESVGYTLSYKEQVARTVNSRKLGTGASKLNPGRSAEYSSNRVYEWIFKQYHMGSETLVFVELDKTEGLEKGDFFARTVYPDGEYKYRNLLGEERSVKKFILDEDQYLRKNGYVPPPK